MSSRAWVAAGAVVGSAIALVLLMRPETASVPDVESSVAPAAPGAPAAPAESVVVPEPGRDVAAVDVTPESTPSPAPPRSPLPGETPPASAPPISPVATFVAANALTMNVAQTMTMGPFADWQKEPVDPEWAPGARTQIVSKIAEQPGLELISVNVECRTTMCYVELAQPVPVKPPGPATPETDYLNTLRIRAPQPAPGAEAATTDLMTSLGMQPRFIMTFAGEPGMQRSIALLMRPGVPPPEMAARHSSEPPAPAEPRRE